MEKIEIILTDCIQEVKAGRATMAECLNRYPERRRELEPLLKMALNIQQPVPLMLDRGFKQVAKARLLQQIRATGQKQSAPAKGNFNFGTQPQFGWAKMALSVIAAVMLMLMLAGGTVYAAQGSQPGDLLYPVKTSSEDVRLLLAGRSPAAAELNLKFARTRLGEMYKLAFSSEEKTQVAVNGYQGNLDAAMEQIRGIKDASTRYQLLERALQELHNQTEYCDKVIDAAPMCVERVIEASDLSVSHQVGLLQILSQDNILRAAQVNLNSMRNRLQRGQLMAGSRHYQSMQAAILQYQQFSRLAEQILQSAQSTGKHAAEIETLCLAALSSSLDVLENLSRQVPQEYRNNIEACRQMTLEFKARVQTEADHGFQQQDANESGQGTTPSQEGNSPASGQESQTTPGHQDETGNTDNLTQGSGKSLSPGTGGETGNGSKTGPGGSLKP